MQDKFIDITGYEIDWHDREDGWTEDRRKRIWNHNLLMMDQRKKLPTFTKSGYKKMDIPPELYWSRRFQHLMIIPGIQFLRTLDLEMARSRPEAEMAKL